ncbi:hypothetical protein TWF679_009411 [Orbilia oligospora]|nr:hypothetical protein TWF679_009411 [Orbilia oligospora]
MGGHTAPSLADFIFDLPFASELGVSKEEAEKYEEMRYSYYEHRATPNEDICAESIIRYLKALTDPPEPVSSFMTLLVEAGVLEDPASETTIVVGESNLGPGLDKQLKGLGESFLELEPEENRPKSLDEDLYVE